MFSTTNLMLVLVGIVALIVAYFVFLYMRNPVLIRLGLRNISRRPTQSALIVVGLTLSTIIFLTSFAIGDTLNYSVQRQAINAYGAIDEVLAPPIFSLLVGMGEPGSAQNSDNQQLTELEQELNQLTEGGLSTVLAIVQGGLPSISEARFRELQLQAEEEPLIDGVAGSILFPTIIRDVSSGQGEPFGFIFAVDDDYDEQFGLATVDGTPVEMEALESGVGNIFGQAANVFDAAGQFGAQLGLDGSSISTVAQVTAAAGAALTLGAEGGFDPAAIELDVETIRSLGIDTTPLDEAGIETLSLETLGITPETLQAAGITTTTLSIDNLNALGIDAGGIQTMTNSLLGVLNLNTLGRELDSALGQVGLQLRQGDVYLNRLGAERLNARVGDVLEIYIGPIPVPFRVKAIVEQAGPTAAIAPVAVMRLDEAQQLLFMPDKINNILVSNLGDETAGIEHTAAVSRHLKVLAMDEPKLEEVVAILRRREVRKVIDAQAESALYSAMDEFDGPPFLVDLFSNITNFDEFGELAAALPAALDEPGISDGLRRALANNRVREWLVALELPAEDAADLRTAMRALNQFDLLDPISKATVVTVAGAGGTAFTSLFSLFGFFSILAGILLIFLIFVMMAAERRSEMGVARAVGIQRTHLVQMFTSEGLVYDFIAAALGILLGLIISYAMVGFIGGLFNTAVGQFSQYGGVFSVRFRAAPPLVVIAYCIGVIFTFVIVTLAAWRVSRLNIVAAIRDLPEPSGRDDQTRAGRFNHRVVGPLRIVLGVILIYYGLDFAFGVVLIGATVVLTGVVVMAGWMLERTTMREETIRHLVYTAIGLGMIGIWTIPWQTVAGQADFLKDGPWVLARFALTAPMVILGAILVVMYNTDLFTWAIGRLLGGFGALTPVLKLAVAYPLSARFRTGTTMLLFAMVITTVTIMTIVIDATQTLVAPDNARQAGFEIKTSFSLLSFFDPIKDLEAAIALNPDFPAEDVAVIGALVGSRINARQDGQDEWQGVRLAGVNDGYLTQAEQTYTFGQRAPGFAGDAEVWAALRTRDDVAVITADLAAQAGAGMGDGNRGSRDSADDDDQQEMLERQIERGFHIQGIPAGGDIFPEIFVTLRSFAPEAAGAEHRVQVIAVFDQGATLAGDGLQMSRSAYEAATGEPFIPENYYIKVSEGANVREIAQQIERSFLSNGLNASIMAESFAQGQALTRGILQLFEGFLALGLLVGIAALGVIGSRTVVERRQQIGMLRAIGFQPRMVALTFLLESSFIALTGMVIGIFAGVVLGQSMVHQFFELLADGRTFATPWLQLATIVLVAYLFSLLATLLPAYQAARIYPAEALRYE